MRSPKILKNKSVLHQQYDMKITAIHSKLHLLAYFTLSFSFQNSDIIQSHQIIWFTKLTLNGYFGGQNASEK